MHKLASKSFRPFGERLWELHSCSGFSLKTFGVRAQLRRQLATPVSAAHPPSLAEGAVDFESRFLKDVYFEDLFFFVFLSCLTRVTFERPSLFPYILSGDCRNEGKRLQYHTYSSFSVDPRA